MIKDFLQHKDIGKIASIAKVSRTYVNNVLNSIDNLDDAKQIGEHSDAKRRILDAVNVVLNEHIQTAENNWIKQKTIHAKKVSRLKRCAKALAR